jgi:hypothetical protein
MLKFQILIHILLGVIALNSCRDYRFTTPICGPESVDRSPMVDLPAEAQGCYQFAAPVVAFSGLVNPLAQKKEQYFKLSVFHDRLVLGSSLNINFENATGGLCRDPRDTTGRGFIIASNSDQWWDFKFVKFAPDWRSFTYQTPMLNHKKLKSSGVPFVLFPVPAFKSRQDSGNQMFEDYLGITLIDNKNMTSAEFFDQLGFEANMISGEVQRVSDDYCNNNRGMKYFSRDGHGLSSSWKRVSVSR